MIAEGIIKSVSGPVIKVSGSKSFQMHELVTVGKEELMGEVIGIDEDGAIVQIYESTEGLSVGAAVKGKGEPLSVLLGPGLMGNIFDGIERPLKVLEGLSGPFIKRGVVPPAIDTEKKWPVKFCVKEGDSVTGGVVIATTEETSSITHKIMVPPNVSGTITYLAPSGDYTINDVIAKVDQTDITMAQKWPVRFARPSKKRLESNILLVTGQRIIDTLYPLAKGGTAAIPGGFGTGKTMTQHQLAKWSDADIIVYIGCGERGNEMTQVLTEFSSLVDPRTGKSLLDRTILIANTSNMPVAAREASIYTGITLAEYYRDMGYSVAIMADSTSRWAEALREISGRLEEMPAEEGFPAYLASRLSEFYERAGLYESLNGSTGSITIIGAVSPTGGDLSEPVTQNTKRFVKTFWALDKSLAYARHYPAIDWNSSYSNYYTELEPWIQENLGDKFMEQRSKIRKLLAEETKLMEIVKLIGSDVLPDDQKLTLEIAKVIREGFLQQNAFVENDSYCPLKKQAAMINIIIYLHEKCAALIDKFNMPISVLKSEGIFESVIAMKREMSSSGEESDNYIKKIDEFYKTVIRKNG
ncbi:MAG: V-type ATP synthase subunit A [Bacillota bacterium]|nr:V-type ATP synthase subunit A [Bacillota bacterium]